MATIEGPLPSHSDSRSAWEEPPLSLGDQFYKRLKRSKFDTKQQFLPEGCLDQLINPQALKDDLFYEKDILDSKDESLVNFINTHAKKVFATAYCALGGSGNTLVATMAYFQSLEFSDKCLPIEDILTDETMRNAPTELPFPFNQPRPLIISRTWAPMRINHFYHHQWKFLAPVFSREHFHHVLSVDIVLPFVWVDKVTKGGRFSKVHKVEIHHGHQRLLDAKIDGTPPYVAIKEILTTENDENLRQEIEANFKIEANALSDIASLEHEHIIERIAAISIDARHYFMFQWADGGNLREFWKENPNPKLTPELVRQSVYQLRGLADALVALHHYKDEANYRHGDLKPENVLRFKDNTFVGHFKIADMGLAKRHTEATDARGGPTSTKFGTTRYEPPETVTSPLEARSRLYDVWSLGCIILEYIIWLLYGYDALDKFSKSVQDEGGCFYVTESVGEEVEVAKIHPRINSWMKDIGNDPECSTPTAIGDLLALVRNKLLIVALQVDTDTTKLGFDPNFVSVTPAEPSGLPQTGPYRAKAKAVNTTLQGIWERGKSNDNYLLANKRRSAIQHPSIATTEGNSNSLEVPKSQNQKEPGPYEDGSGANSNESLNHTWDFYIDNIFAEKIIQRFDQYGLDLSLSQTTNLCLRCEGLDLLSPTFRVSDTTFNLSQKAKVCGLCRLLSIACQNAGLSGHIRVYRIGSTLRTDDITTPLLSIVRSHEITPSSDSLQYGYPRLSASNSEIHFEIIQQWIQDCDGDPTHEDCRHEDTPHLPSRLLEVTNDKIRLVETQYLRDRYLALSHPWGDPEEHSHFCTYTSNIADHMEEIEWGALPKTFKDAVTITRKLGFRYLWIDSLCIIQGADGDFTEQSKHMEEVFSSAYCVLAASRATGQCDGFLGDRRARDYVTLNGSEGVKYHICEQIDNFQGDVIDGALNRRGWVLQERALARRTVYFTKEQTYWECGGGIRCETFTKMKNNTAAFLGDPRFPKVAMDTTRAEKIFLYQRFYEQYSKLQFSKIEDRPFAIAGLEKRLIQGFGAQGGYGIIDDRKGLLHRSLLWRRLSNGAFQRIQFPPERRVFVPTWSWMAYEGGIEYLSPTQDGTKWEENDVRSPWSEDSPAYYTTDKNSTIFLDVTAKAFDIEHVPKEQVTLHFDIPEKGDCQTPGLRCVILAHPKAGSKTTDRRWYVLFVAPQISKKSVGSAIFERVGVGRLPESCILQSDKIEVKLQ